MFNILENVKNLSVHYSCVVCGTEVHKEFIETSVYKKLQEDDSDVIDYVEAHLSFFDVEKMEKENVVMELHSSICDNRDCKRAQLKKIKETQLEGIKVPVLFKDVKPVDTLTSEFADKLGVLYTGDVGVGKTHKAIALLKRVILSKGGPDKCSYKFINVCALFFKLQEEMKYPNKDKPSILRKCMNVDILVLDDLGTEKFSDWTEAQIYLLLNSRIENMKLTIVTSNIGKKDELDTKFNPRIASRLCLFNVKNISGVDRRRI